MHDKYLEFCQCDVSYRKVLKVNGLIATVNGTPNHNYSHHIERMLLNTLVLEQLGALSGSRAFFSAVAVKSLPVMWYHLMACVALAKLIGCVRYQCIV